MRRPILPSWMSRFKAGRKISCRSSCNSRRTRCSLERILSLSSRGTSCSLRGSCPRISRTCEGSRVLPTSSPGPACSAEAWRGLIRDAVPGRPLDVTRFANRCGVTRANATGDSNDPLLSLLLHLGVALLFHAAFNVGRFIDLAVVPVHFHLAVRFALLHPVPQCAGCE